MRLHSGQFFGHYQARRSLPDGQLADLRPTIPAHEVAEHTHDEGHFILLLSGQYVSTAVGMPAVCTRPALLLNPPGTHHRDHFRHLDAQFFTFSLTDRAWRDAANEVALPTAATKLTDGALVAGYRLRDELLHWDDVSPLVVESEYRELLLAACQANACIDDRTPDRISRARERLRDNPVDPPRMAELAREADLHPVYFARAFRRRYGCSPGQYLRRCRLDRAVALLCDRRLPVSQVAAHCGFVDQSHLSHAFRNQYGTSPNAFRQLVHQQVSCIQDAATSPA